VQAPVKLMVQGVCGKRVQGHHALLWVVAAWEAGAGLALRQWQGWRRWLYRLCAPNGHNATMPACKLLWVVCSKA